MLDFMKFISTFIIIPLLLGPALAQARASACSTKALKELKAAVLSLAEGRNPDLAWRVVRTMLCGEKKDETFALAHIKPRLVSKSFGTGDEKETVESVDRGLNLMLRGRFQDARALAEDGGIILSYRIDEACLGGFTLNQKDSRWLVTSLENACD